MAVTKLHPPGAICIASGELARFPHFTHSMLHCLRPSGTTIEMHCGLNVADNFNAGVRRMLANPLLEWAWIMGDDHEFDPRTLSLMLDRNVDILVPLVARRQPPFIPVLFKHPLPHTPKAISPVSVGRVAAAWIAWARARPLCRGECRDADSSARAGSPERPVV